MGFSFTNDDKERFWSKINKTHSCWEWTGSVTIDGYGQFSLGRKMIKAHRFSYFLKFGEIPKSKIVCHSCDNPRCVRPSHLWIGTQKQNMQDMKKKGRSPNRNGENHWNSILTEKQVIEIREKYEPFIYTAVMLSDEYGISVNGIRQVLKEYTWKHI